MSAASKNDPINEAIAEKHGMSLLQAEIYFAIVSVMGLTVKGTLCYHGFHPPKDMLLLLLKMKEAGFDLTADRFSNHVKIMHGHGLVHNTEQGNKMALDYLAGQTAQDPNTKIEDN